MLFRSDKGAFKAPTLRSVALTAPYMHDGSQKTLEEVVEWYDKGGHPNPQLSPKVKKIGLNEQERKELPIVGVLHRPHPFELAGQRVVFEADPVGGAQRRETEHAGRRVELVGATAEATGAIMDSCERVQALFPKMDPAVAAVAEAEITKVFEACSFQDITGQRITKVVKTLKKIDEKITALLAVLGTKAPGYDEVKEEEETFLAGPQLPGKGISQTDIDKLLAEFGK